MGFSSTHRSLQLLFGSLLLQRLPLKGFFCGGGWRQVFRTEAKTLQKLENATILFLELCDQVALCPNFARKLETEKKNSLSQ